MNIRIKNSKYMNKIDLRDYIASYKIFIVVQNNYKEHKINVNLYTRSVIKI